MAEYRGSNSLCGGMLIGRIAQFMPAAVSAAVSLGSTIRCASLRGAARLKFTGDL